MAQPGAVHHAQALTPDLAGQSRINIHLNFFIQPTQGNNGTALSSSPVIDCADLDLRPNLTALRWKLMNQIGIGLPTLALWVAAPLAAQTPAFPGAEGAGAFATGGRSGTVYRVTNLNTSGPGSLADAVSRPNRIVVFTVSGAIDLSGKRKIDIAQPNITIAGQSAPGEGICLRGGSLRVSAGNVIIRHIRIRRGFHQIGDMGDGLNVKGDFADVMIDHVSTAWATDENLTLTQANRVTAQFSIAAEGLDYFNPNQSPNRHSEGSLFGSATPGGQMTIHHTLYAHNRLRNARTTGGGNPAPDLDFRNNVIYDAREYTTHTGNEPVHLNLVNNYYKDGPSTEPGAKA
jgi:pectate lyase